MQSKSRSTSQVEVNPYYISQSAACSEPWWHSAGYKSITSPEIGGNTSNSSLQQSKDGYAQSDGRLYEENDNATKESKNNGSPHSDGNHGQDYQNFQHQAPPSNGILPQPPQLELVGHSIACASNPYQDPYYASMMAAYGPQAVVPPHVLDMHHLRMPLPLEMEQQPVYVNAKQYHGILRRRQSRAKAELEKKLIKVRKPYLHESRHQHAVKRARVSGGRFAKKSDVGSSKCTGEETGSHSASSSGSEPVHHEAAAETWNSHQEDQVGEICETQGRSSFQASTYSAHSAKGGEEGDSSGQQWGSISESNKASSQRATAI